MTEFSSSVQFVEIDENNEQQRIDNFLKSKLKGVPKSLIYKVIRKGEVRINKKRIKPEYKLQIGDLIRIPPIRVSEQDTDVPSVNLNKVSNIESAILFEDNHLLVINKPSGLAVHGGSGLSFGLIEGLRALRPQEKFLELVHRIDRDTSGCILVAKKRSALKHLQAQLRERTMIKQYLALVRGQWESGCNRVEAPLLKNTLKSGERVVRVDVTGKPSLTRFKIEKTFANATLVKASPVTGRTHQIRVHALHQGHPIACDPKYGDEEFDERMNQFGLKRLFLHAAELKFIHPQTEKITHITADLDNNLKATLKNLSEI